MKHTLILMAACLLTGICSCNGQTTKTEDKQMEKPTPQVLISTSLGDIVVRLYDDTPAHRDNFLKLAREGFYDGTLFHRVILQVA